MIKKGKKIKIYSGDIMKYLNFILRLSFFLFLIGILILSGIYLYATSNKIDNIGLNQKIEVYDVNNELLLTLNNGKQTNHVDFKDINKYIRDGFISIEDKKFYRHDGFDIKRIIKAMQVNIFKKTKAQGASTISQQLSRNLYLSTEKTWSRKILEAYYTIQIENSFSKDEIFEAYLNTINFGHGVYGVEDASYFYFHKQSKDLTLGEAATLIAIPRNPTYYSPINDFEFNQQRKNLILDEMLEDGYITKDEHLKATNEAIKIYGESKKSLIGEAPYFQDLIISELEDLDLINNPKYPYLKVYTTCSIEFSKIVDEAIADNISSDLETAVIVMDANTGYVYAVNGGKSYLKSTYNRAIYAKRQPGSTIKPFLYYRALELGVSPLTTFESRPTTFYLDDGSTYTPSNYGGVYPYQAITMAYAIAVSDNIYAVKTHITIGQNELVKTLRRFGFMGEILAVPSLALGTNLVTLEELVTGYAHFASEGKKTSPIYIKSIVTNKDLVIYKNEINNNKILNDDSTYIINELLTGVFDTKMNVFASVTGSTLASKITHTYSAKSGSTDFDNWIVGYNRQYVVGVWSGFDDQSEVTELNDRTASKEIWFDVMESIMKGKESTPYTKPNNVYSVYANPITGVINDKYNYNKNIFVSEIDSFFK